MTRLGVLATWGDHFIMFFRRNSQPSTERIVLTVPVPAPLPAVAGAKKVLIVDDDAVMLKALSLALRASGYEVVTATDAAEAMSQVSCESPDLLIVDVSLAADPLGCGALGWDGFQFARWLRGSSCQAPLIIISATDGPEYRTQTSAAGAAAFLTKPIEMGTLRATVASLLSRRQSFSLAGV